MCKKPARCGIWQVGSKCGTRSFGGQDCGITPDDVHKFEATLKQLSKPVDIKIYDDAGHAFENPNNNDGYRAADAADAWKRTVDFLTMTLKK
jgi:carboxymethylenebutenolidase